MSRAHARCAIGNRGGTRRLRAAVLGLMLLAAGNGGARAEPAPDHAHVAGGDSGSGSDSGDDRPWAAGVSPERQRKAQALYDAGNALLQDFLLPEAVDKYREALRYWEHPGIHYNLAKALYNLGQPLAAYDSMREALRYGPAALQEREYEQARNFQALLASQLGELVVASAEPGVEILLDGEAMPTDAGVAHRRVLPGEHLLVVNKPGFQTVTRRLHVPAGRRSEIALEARRRWQRWEPWAVLGYGATVGITGALLQWRASVNLQRYRREFERTCPDGCQDSDVPTLSALRTRGTWQSRVGVTAMVTGGAVALAGTAMLVLNRSRSFRVHRDRGPERPRHARGRVRLVPALSAGTLGVSARLWF